MCSAFFYIYIWYKIKAAFEKVVCICAVSQPCFPFIKIQDGCQGQPKLSSSCRQHRMNARLLGSRAQHFRLLLVIQKHLTDQWCVLLLYQKA